jgi:hypothetical protein
MKRRFTTVPVLLALANFVFSGFAGIVVFVVFVGFVAFGFALSGVAAAQPTLDSLWPNEDGKRWTYEGTYEELTPPAEFVALSATLTFNGTVPLLGGGTGQNLEEFTSVLPTSFAASDMLPGDASRFPLGNPPRSLPAFWRYLWMGRPDLREAIEDYFESRPDLRVKRDVFWPSLLLSGGQFVKTSTRIGTWSEVEPDFGWWSLTDDLTNGATWSKQLVPSLADDVWLYGTVASVSATVETAAGTFTNAVQMDYLVDQGEQLLTNEQGEVIGTGRSEVSGTVYFVPDVGPVQSFEQFELTEWTCDDPECPPFEVGVLSTATLDLIQQPVATEQQSWGHVKALFGND